VKQLVRAILFVLAVGFPVHSGQPLVVVNANKDAVQTLIGRKSTDLAIYGLRLGITHEQAWVLIQKEESLLGLKDAMNPSRIYVYNKKPDGTKGENLFYLIWNPGEKYLTRITFFQDSRSHLSPSFRRILTFEALDNNSEFKRKFIGYANSSKTTLNVPEVRAKHITYYYDEIGLEIVHQRHGDRETIVFALVRPKP
jgi:hypothetical protein